MAFIVTGGSQLRGAMRAMSDAAEAATRKATATGAHLIEAEIKKALKQNTHQRGTPTPSQPGQPPALVSGQLRRSVKVEGPSRLAPGVYQARIGPTAVYGRIQELGGMAGQGRGTRLPARPYVAPSVATLTASGRLADTYTTAWRIAMRLS